MNVRAEPGPRRPHLPFRSLALLFATGSLLGLSTIFAKLAPSNGLAPSAFLVWSVTGAAAILTVARLLTRQAIPSNGRSLEYYVVAAIVSLAGPNLILFTAVEHVGASFVALAIAFPPLLTYVAAVLFVMERFDAGRALGVLVALCGAIVIAWLKFAGSADNTNWILATLVAPVLLASGNIYRSLRWPRGAKPEDLAPGMLIAASIMLMFVVFFVPSLRIVVSLTSVAVGLIGLQSVAFAIQYRLFFMLQQQGGPVLVSLLGSVAAIVAVPIAIGLLGEGVPKGFWLGTGLIALGVLLVVGRAANQSAKDSASQSA